MFEIYSGVHYEFIHVELKSPRFTHTCEGEASNSYIGSKWQFHVSFWL